MRRLHFDQYEFEDTGSEEELDIVIGTTRQFRDLSMFVHRAGLCHPEGLLVAEMPMRPLTEFDRWQLVLDNLRRFAGLSLPDGAQAIVLRDDWDDVELVIVAGRYFVWFRWSMTA